MKYPWLFALVLLLTSGAVIITYSRIRERLRPVETWVSGTGLLQALPSYLSARTKTRSTAVVGSLLLIVLSVSLAVSAGLPVERKVEHPDLGSRDIVVCLDASGSMLPYDGEILRNFARMTESFEGERISLHLWSAQTVIRFPLTDDYELAQDVMHEGATIIDRGYFGPEGDYVLVSHELADYLEGIEAPDGEMISSLVGDGLATCVLGFDHLDTDRSRTVILATDNEVMGPQIYTTAQAIEFADDHDVDVIALYPGEGGVIKAEGEQLKSLVEATGGDFYNAQDPASIDSVIRTIEAQQLVGLEDGGVVREVGHPRGALLWAAWSLLGLLLLAGVRRI